MILLGAFFIIKYEKNKAMDGITAEADRLSSTILLGAHYAMMLNARDDITHIIQNIAKQPQIENIRIFNKAGEIHFSNINEEVGSVTNIKAEACYVCHKTEPPSEYLELNERKRIIMSPRGYRLMGIISPIFNEPGCSESCHFHPKDKIVLGALDVVISLEQTDAKIAFYEKGLLFFAFCIVFICSSIIGIFVLRFVNQPIKKLIRGTRQISKGSYGRIEIIQDGEIKQLADAINHMAEQIEIKQNVLNEQRTEYQNLFEAVPCLITVQNKNFQLLKYNREFNDRFHPKERALCFQAYKNQSEPCEQCPVAETFRDGKPHHSEQSGISKNGNPTYWTLRTAPIKNREGMVTAVMEISVDITQIRLLEKEVRKSEEKYRAIFDNIPNPLFVLEQENLLIIDCNASVESVYGFTKQETLNRSFEDFFDPEIQTSIIEKIKSVESISKVRQIGKNGKIIFTNIHVSPSEYPSHKVLLVNTTDITKRLIAEQQLIQASKMATLGEMATGIAHELNQPLSVIKSASNFITKKAKLNEIIPQDIMTTMTEEIDGQVDRASKIISHMREFGRKSDVIKEKAQVNNALIKAFDIFREQLKLRQIEVIQNLQEDLPRILADENRLEQVFINLLINARDAIEEHAGNSLYAAKEAKQIFLTTKTSGNCVAIEIEDTGNGIPATIADKIFEPFFTTKDVGKGTGLGLSISYGIIQDYGGTITVTSGRLGGALFIIKFPIITA
ncbi:MAG: PAS domain S-box protein [Desulfobacteraceae bacterium]|nr:PAS domain S-box protein [Desulfobacteraceae bacterium]MBC2754184.1 PAS domain S-box protein [Desulfobacteraceae bacterium]